MKTLDCTNSVRATASTGHRIEAGDKLVSGKTPEQIEWEQATEMFRFPPSPHHQTIKVRYQGKRND